MNTVLLMILFLVSSNPGEYTKHTDGLEKQGVYAAATDRYQVINNHKKERASGLGQTGFGHNRSDALSLQTQKSAVASTQSVSNADSLALVALYEETNGSQWTSNDNWLEETVAEWFGVTVEGGLVTELNLVANNLTGSIHPDIGNLADLEELWLDDNQLNGEIPAELGQLTNLEWLSLSGNSLDGGIPAELAQINNLKFLFLYDNNISSTIPAELGNLANLEVLSLYENALTGGIPIQLRQLSNLRGLFLYDNSLSGSIPAELEQLADLEELYLNDNEFTGDIPPSLGNLLSLEWLNLSGNQLSGSIPQQLGGAPGLTGLYLHDNELTGEIPIQLSWLSNLEELLLHNNNLGGEIPSELGQLANLEELSLFANDFEGSIPPQIGSLSMLEQLWLDNNRLSGEIPPELGSLSGLQVLTLSGNSLNGKIPSELGNLTNLWSLFLDGNALEGDIPEAFTGLTNLDPEWTSISYNMLTASEQTVQDFLDMLDESWYQTQTVTPANIVVRNEVTGSNVEVLETPNEYEVTWEPIAYTDDEGYYIIRYGTDRENLADSVITNDKTESVIFITGLDSATEYFFAVQTRTEAHERNPNRLTSPLSERVNEKTETGSEEKFSEKPETFKLNQNYPNPFNPATQIVFAIPEQVHVRLQVYNMLGQQVSTLVDETRGTGWHNVRFDAANLSSGTYIYRLEAGDFIETRKMLFVK